MKPDELLLNYIKANYQDKITANLQIAHQSKINIDFTLLNEYFEERANRGFFRYDKWKKILYNAEMQLNYDNKRNSKNWISLKITDVPPNITLHDLNSTFNGDVISAKALIKNISEPRPALKTAVYECRSCMRLHEVEVIDGIATPPAICNECGGKQFRLDDDLSEFRDYRYVKLEEPLEYRTGGATKEFKAYMQDYLASPFHNLKAGDVVDILGEFTIRKSEKNNKKGEFEFLINLHNINTVNNAFEDYSIT